MATKKKSKKVAAKKAKAATKGEGTGNSVTVPAKNVGAACQAAVSFENATRVEAVRLDAAGEQYVVTWS